jgi:thiamine-phosphate pyrophosphorylase
MSDLPRGLYAVTPDGLDQRTLISRCRRAIAGGVVMLQYRSQEVPDATLGRALCELCTDAGVRFIVNDDPMLAARTGADGVHLGRHDMSIEEARAILGPGGIIGASCYGDLEYARAARDAGADYLAFGSVMPSPTKPEAPQTPIGILTEAGTLGLPVVAIGGITLAVAPALIAAGADLLAVISDLFQHPDPQAQAAAYAACFATPLGDDT